MAVHIQNSPNFAAVEAVAAAAAAAVELVVGRLAANTAAAAAAAAAVVQGRALEGLVLAAPRVGLE